MTEKFAVAQMSEGIQIQRSPTGDYSLLAFKTEMGVIGIGVDDAQLDMLLSMIVEHAMKTAEPPTERTVTKAVSTDLLPARAVAIGAGPNNNLVTVMVELGRVNMAFVVNKESAESACQDLADDSYKDTGLSTQRPQ